MGRHPWGVSLGECKSYEHCHTHWTSDGSLSDSSGFGFPCIGSVHTCTSSKDAQSLYLWSKKEAWLCLLVSTRWPILSNSWSNSSKTYIGNKSLCFDRITPRQKAWVLRLAKSVNSVLSSSVPKLIMNMQLLYIHSYACRKLHSFQLSGANRVLFHSSFRRQSHGSIVHSSLEYRRAGTIAVHPNIGV